MLEVIFSQSIHERDRQFEALRKVGINPVNEFSSDTRWIFNASVIYIEDIKRNAHRAPIINYVWDLYEWAVEGPEQGYKWKDYIKFLEGFPTEIWVPNKGTQLRVKEYTGRDSKIVPCGFAPYDRKREAKDYALHHMRDYPVPEAEWMRGWDKVIHSNHAMGVDRFRSHVTGAKFLVTPYTEASTGGLTLLEGLWNGVPSLVADGDYSGGAEYLGEFGTTFKAGDYEDFQLKFNEMWENPPKIDIEKARVYLEDFTLDGFAKRIKENLDESSRSDK